MRRYMILTVVFCFLSISFFSCGADGGSSPDSGSSEQSSASAGAAIVAIFSQGSDTSPSGKRLVAYSSTCTSSGAGTDGVYSSDRGTPGTYGAVEQQVNVAATDFCTNPSTSIA